MRASRPNRPLNGVDCYVMENMDIDMVIDIPDTPDRVSRRSSLGREGNRRGSAAAAVGCPREFQLIDEEYCNYLGGKDRLVPGVGKTSKHRSESKKHCNNQTDNINDTHASRNTPLFRRATIEKDKGKSICTDFPVTSSASMQKNPGLNPNQFNGCARVLEMAAPKRLPSEGIPIRSGLPLHGSRNSLKASDNNNKGKEKIDNSSGEVACSASNRETNNLSGDPRRKKEDHASSSSRPIVRASGHRRLVRNGCISPHVIAARAKQSAEYQTNSNGDINVRSGEDKTTSGDLSSIDIREIVAEDNIRNRIQGKRAIVHSHTSKDDGATSINGDSMRSRDAAGAEGWRSTRNRQKVGCSHPNVGHNIGRHRETNRRDEDDSQRSFRSMAEQHEINVVDQNANKRQRRIGFTSAVSDEQEVSIVGTSGEASSSRPARRQNQQRRGMHIPVLEIDDSSPEVQLNRRQGTRRVENDGSDVRVKQIEADERLARELQEQLYQEAQFFGDEEINENLARMLQEEENSSRPSSRNPRRTNHNPSVGRGRSRLRTRFQQSSSSRRPNIPQPRASVRRTRSRGNRLGPPPATLRRALNLRFPSEMALESRLDILEEIETVIGQLGSSMNSGLLQLDRDFNEDDYEMLLALDDISNHNDQRGGTSANQINNLPQSTVQNDNFEETCAICLETPTTGDVIRHLPCLHKFHKDCIDPWLRRSKSCPVCKSSVT